MSKISEEKENSGTSFSSTQLGTRLSQAAIDSERRTSSKNSSTQVGDASNCRDKAQLSDSDFSAWQNNAMKRFIEANAVTTQQTKDYKIVGLESPFCEAKSGKKSPATPIKVLETIKESSQTQECGSAGLQ